MVAPSLPTESALAAQLRKEGLAPTRWSNGPHAVYAVHEHVYGKVLVVASGSITFTTGPEHTVVQVVASLNLANHRVRRMLRGGFLHHCLVNARIEGLAQCFERFDMVIFEHFEQLFVD